MIKQTLLLLLCFSSAWTYVYVASGTKTVISNGTVTENTHPPYPRAAFNNSNAKWIWNQNWQRTPHAETLTFMNTFTFRHYCTCTPKNLILRMTADNYFSAYINGEFVLSGNEWRRVYEITIPEALLNPQGTNTLVVVAGN